MKFVYCLLVSLLISTAALAKEELPELKVHKQSDVAYISGGADPLERKAMHRLSGRYWMQFSISAGEDAVNVTGVKVTLRDIRGVALMETTSEGPLFFMTPPQGGRYTVEFVHDGETISHTMDLVGRRYIQMEIRFKQAGAQ